MSKQSKPDQILTLILQPDIWSALMRIVAAARWKDLAALARKESRLYVIHADKVTPDAILELQNYETLLIIIQGKISKSVLSADERAYLAQQIRESNAWLN